MKGSTQIKVPKDVYLKAKRLQRELEKSLGVKVNMYKCVSMLEEGKNEPFKIVGGLRL